MESKDSINSLSTKCSSNNNSLSSFSKISSMVLEANNNIFKINFDNKEEYIKYNGEYINELY
jgi:hypothetical protein